MHIIDIAQNSITAGSKNIMVEINEDLKNNLFSFIIIDDGNGMSREMTEKVRNPFTTSRTTRKVGLGIPMLEQSCIQCNGRLDLESEPGRGTKLSAYMEYYNIDRPPMGDIVNSVFLLIIMNPDVDFLYKHTYNGRDYELDTKEIKEVLGDLPINDSSVLDWIKDNIKEGLEEIMN